MIIKTSCARNGEWLIVCPYRKGIKVGSKTCRICSEYGGYIRQTNTLDVVCRAAESGMIEIGKQEKAK